MAKIFVTGHKGMVGSAIIDKLSKLNKINKKLGAVFSSHIDGKKFILSPEKSIQIQKSINSDIMMVLDECPKLTSDKKILQGAIDISTDHICFGKKISFEVNPLR